MIFKLQKSIAPVGRVLIYNEDRSYQGEIPLPKDLDELFGDRFKMYAHGFIDDKGQLHLEEEAETQDW